MKQSLNQRKKASVVLASLFLLLAFHAFGQGPDAAPTVDSVSADPVYAGLGDTIIIYANASDDAGLKGIYFYSPDSSEFAFMDWPAFSPGRWRHRWGTWRWGRWCCAIPAMCS